MANDDYVQTVERWRSEMDAKLRRENDWLALAGLFWLKKGVNTLGSSPDCDIHLPRQAPPLLGALVFNGTDVTLQVDIGQRVQINGFPLHSAAPLRADDDENPSYITFRDLRLVVIRRSGGVAVRLWDNSRPQRSQSPQRVWFAVDPRYRLEALYTAFPVPVKVSLPNVFGQNDEGFVQGYVSFRLEGKTQTLDATEVENGRIYLRFKDLTSGSQTYPSGRYLYTEPVGQDGRVVVDFNMAYNPPCAFTDYATCSFAPSSNHLKVAIAAGERYEGRH